jgi:hypothetical protein
VDELTVEAPTPVEDGLLCGFGGCEHISPSPQGMGMHRFHSHGIRSAKRQTPSKTVVENIKGTDIVNVVLTQLFPHGIPVSKVRAVLAWAQHTDDFVEQIQ